MTTGTKKVSLGDIEARTNTNRIDDLTISAIVLVGTHKFRAEMNGREWDCPCAACDWARLEIERRRLG